MPGEIKGGMLVKGVEKSLVSGPGEKLVTDGGINEMDGGKAGAGFVVVGSVPFNA